MRLCMFRPEEVSLERGWVGRIDGEHVVHIAAQTLESFFTGGGSAREHAVYPLDAVRLLAPVLHPPAVRLFDDDFSFAFANPAAIVGPGHVVRRPPCDDQLQGLLVLPRVAGVVGAGEQIAGFTLLAEWRDPSRAAPKDRDFALGLGPVVVTGEPSAGAGAVRVRAGGEESLATTADGFDWAGARELAADGTVLRPGDLLASPPLGSVVVPAGRVEIEAEVIGALDGSVGRG